MKLQICLALPAFLLVSMSAFANQPYILTDFSERYSKDVGVSGSILASLSFSGDSDSVNTNELFINVDNEVSVVYVRLSSIDGLYSANFKLSLSPREESDWLQIDVPSEIQDTLTKYKSTELVAYVYSESTYRDKYIQIVYPSAWGQPDNKEHFLLVNSVGLTASFAYKSINGETVHTQCHTIIADVIKGFNRVCPLSPENMDKHGLIVVNTAPNSNGKSYMLWLPSE